MNETVEADALDLGGVGKGYALDRAAELLAERGVTEAFLHGGSSTVLAIGTWTVGREMEKRRKTTTSDDRRYPLPALEFQWFRLVRMTP